jgi:hypothetical protein
MRNLLVGSSTWCKSPEVEYAQPEENKLESASGNGVRDNPGLLPTYHWRRIAEPARAPRRRFVETAAGTLNPVLP